MTTNLNQPELATVVLGAVPFTQPDMIAVGLAPVRDEQGNVIRDSKDRIVYGE